jgi:hypothetical protein
VLPKGFHRIRHYGLLASSVKADNLVLAGKLLGLAPPAPEPQDIASDPATPVKPCPCCSSAMRIIEMFKAGEPPRHRPTAMPIAIRIDTSWAQATSFTAAVPICLAGPEPAATVLI